MLAGKRYASANSVFYDGTGRRIDFVAVVYGVPLAVFASGLLIWAIARDVMRLYDRCKGPVVGETHLTRASS